MKYERGNVVEFTKGAYSLEVYADSNMKARILDIYEYDVREENKPEEDVWVVVFKYDEFDTHNKKFEESNYYDKNRVPCLTAREAGFYTPTEKVYLPCHTLWDNYFKVIDET